MTENQNRVEYGVVLDDQGSTDTYDTEAEARAHATADSPIVRIVTTPIDEPSVQPPTPEQIAETIEALRLEHPPWRRTPAIDAVLALFQQPAPEQIAEHRWAYIFQERLNEISMRCSCGWLWKHLPMDHMRSVSLPRCPDDQPSQTVETPPPATPEANR